ncbi:PilN domain-containing protein [Candidatus Daviesbacteria bacterium]|nr:PilN domain-containing protein [Candidatus Daviesbacteria bacterium]
MPKSKSKITINLDLLKPQSNPEKLLVKFFRWLLSSGRFIFILVEAVVLIAFFTRFKLDADLAARKETIEEQIPFIESLKPDETLIRQTQLKLSTIYAFSQNSPNYDTLLKKLTEHTPVAVKINSLSLEKTVNKITVQINAQTPDNIDLVTFMSRLKDDQYFTDVSLTSAGLEENILKFTIDASVNILSGKTL